MRKFFFFENFKALLKTMSAFRWTLYFTLVRSLLERRRQKIPFKIQFYEFFENLIYVHELNKYIIARTFLFQS